MLSRKKAPICNWGLLLKASAQMENVSKPRLSETVWRYGRGNESRTSEVEQLVRTKGIVVNLFVFGSNLVAFLEKGTIMYKLLLARVIAVDRVHWYERDTSFDVLKVCRKLVLFILAP